MTSHCTQCLIVVEERLGYETPRGELLCGPCYYALWGGTGAAARDGRRPSSRRPRRGRPIWIPGPSAELDPELKVRHHRWWRRG